MLDRFRLDGILRASALALGALALSGLSGCRPEIGDSCALATDCSAQGDRLCDTTQPEGYCTIFSCEPDACPEEAVCIGFEQVLDPTCEVSGTDPSWQRFERTFCMFACEEDDDCREGYRCFAPTSRRAISIDQENELASSKVCMPDTGADLSTPSDPPACSE